MGCSVSKEEEGMVQFKYYWMNLETEDAGESNVYCVNYLDFLHKINEFNKLGGSKWKFWIK